MNTEILAARAKEGDADAFPNVTVDGVRLSMGGGFYDGYYMSNEGGGMCLKDEDVENYRFADGSMEYRIHLSTTERGFMLNKPIHVEFREIGYNTSELSEPVTDVEGSWTIEWTLQGSNEIYEADIEHGVIGDTGPTWSCRRSPPGYLCVIRRRKNGCFGRMTKETFDPFWNGKCPRSSWVRK